MEKEAVIVVDYQNDFANPETWSLYVSGWEKIAWAINKIVSETKTKWWIVISSRELHPAWHISFASNFKWKESIIEAFKRGEAPSSKNFITTEEIEGWSEENNWLSPSADFSVEELKAYIATVWDQAMWPDHCVEWSFWSAFYKDFDSSMVDIEIKKWFEADSHPYSAFGWVTMDGKKAMIEVLKEAWVKVLKVVWLATDYCDIATVMDGIKNDFKVEFILEASAWVDPAGTIEALRKMREAWVKIVE